jgi:hypothetical protein
VTWVLDRVNHQAKFKNPNKNGFQANPIKNTELDKLTQVFWNVIIKKKKKKFFNLLDQTNSWINELRN